MKKFITLCLAFFSYTIITPYHPIFPHSHKELDQAQKDCLLYGRNPSYTSPEIKTACSKVCNALIDIQATYNNLMENEAKIAEISVWYNQIKPDQHDENYKKCQNNLKELQQKNSNLSQELGIHTALVQTATEEAIFAFQSEPIISALLYRYRENEIAITAVLGAILWGAYEIFPALIPF